jgi:hypothetical protein
MYIIACGPIRRDFVFSPQLHCHDFCLPSILAGRFNVGDHVILKGEGQRATLIDDVGPPVGVKIKGEQKLITILKVKDDNGKVYTDPLAWKLRNPGQWERSAYKDCWRSIQHTDTRHPDDSEYRTLSLGTVQKLRDATDNLLPERGGGMEMAGSKGSKKRDAGAARGGEHKKRKIGENKKRGENKERKADRSVNGGAEKDENCQLCSHCNEIHPQKYTPCHKCGKCYHHNQYEEREKHKDGRCIREGGGGIGSGGGGGGGGSGDSSGSGEARGVGGGKDARGGRMGSGGLGGGSSAGSSSNGGGNVMAGLSGKGDGRERHSADLQGLDRHRNNQKVLQIKYKARRHGSSCGVAVVGGRVGIDKTRRSGDGREKRLRLLARYNRFFSFQVKKQAGASHGEVKRMVTATWRSMSEKEKARWDVPASQRALGPRGLDRYCNNQKMLKIKNQAGRQLNSGGVTGVGGGKRRSVNQVCAETRQVGWLHVSLCVFAHA